MYCVEYDKKDKECLNCPHGGKKDKGFHHKTNTCKYTYCVRKCFWGINKAKCIDVDSDEIYLMKLKQLINRR